MVSTERKVHARKCSICEKVNNWEHGFKHKVCQKCGALYWDKPKDEAILFNLQDKYLENRNDKYLGLMYSAMLPYAEKIILKQLPFKYDETKLEEKVQDTVTTVIRNYLTKPDYKVLHSFGGTLFGPSRQELYKKRQKDIDNFEVSYDSPISDSDEKTFKDTLSSDSLHDGERYSKELLDKFNKQYLTEELSRFSTEIYKTITKNHDFTKAILSMVLIHHFINKKKDEFFDKFYKQFGTNLQEFLEKEKILLLQYINEAAS